MSVELTEDGGRALRVRNVHKDVANPNEVESGDEVMMDQNGCNQRLALLDMPSFL
jgi:hypothetical protein